MNNISRIDNRRWRAIYNYFCLGKKHRDIVGEVVDGVALSSGEVNFVELKLKEKGVCLH